MKLKKLIATFGGLGYMPFAPGTFGALGGLGISAVLSYFIEDHVLISAIHVVLITLFYILGVWSCNSLIHIWGEDPSKVVVDETIGFWISVLFLPQNISVWLAGFVMFRFFDILKPLGIKRLDRIKNAHGIMLDDVVAGIYAQICVQIFYYFNLLA